MYSYLIWNIFHYYSPYISCFFLSESLKFFKISLFCFQTFYSYHCSFLCVNLVIGLYDASFLCCELFKDLSSLFIFLTAVFALQPTHVFSAWVQVFNFFRTFSKINMAPIFTLIGDSNLRRHMSRQNCQGRTPMSSAEVKICGRIESFAETLRSMRSTSTVCVIACLTNFLTSTEGASTSAAIRVQPTLIEFRDIILDFCSEQPERYDYKSFIDN